MRQQLPSGFAARTWLWPPVAWSIIIAQWGPHFIASGASCRHCIKAKPGDAAKARRIRTATILAGILIAMN
jgi:hypothetical protein